MSIFQKLLVAIYLSLTAFFVILDNLYPGAAFVNYMKFAAIVLLFLIAVLIPKMHHEQKILTKAMFFVVLGDFFLVFCNAFLRDAGKLMPLGVLNFSVAYFFVIMAFQKNFKIGRPGVVTLTTVLLFIVPAVVVLYPYLHGFLRYGLLLFIGLLGYCSWTCLCTVYRGYFNRLSSYRIAVAGILMLICDLGVGVSMFHPSFSGQFVPLIKNIIWGAYLPAWTLIVVIIAERKLTLQ